LPREQPRRAKAGRLSPGLLLFVRQSASGTVGLAESLGGDIFAQRLIVRRQLEILQPDDDDPESLAKQ
jgi:hypothetical protein